MIEVDAEDILAWLFANSNDPPRQGAWSDRSMGVHAGSMGGGDGAKQKIGREIIPWNQSGFRGGPSAAADATASIYQARVNKGYEPGEGYGPMFPDQDNPHEIEDQGEYHATRKLPRTNMVRRPINLTLREADDKEVITELLRIKDVLSDLMGDAVAAFIGSLDGFDVPFLVLLLFKNRRELKSNIVKANELMPPFADLIITLEGPSEDAEDIYDDLHNIALDLVVDIVDMFQAIGYALPGSIGTSGSAFLAGQVATLIGKMALRQLADIKGHASLLSSLPTGEKGATLGDLVKSPQWENIKAEFTYVNPGGITMVGAAFSTIGRIDALLDEYDKLKKVRFRSVRRGVSTAVGSIRKDIEKSTGGTIPPDTDLKQPQAKVPVSQLLNTDQLVSFLKKELSKAMTIKELRQLIRETVYNMYNVPSLHEPQPEGYMFREIPDLSSIMNSEDDPDDYLETQENYDDFLVSYAVDNGIFADKPNVVSESISAKILKKEIERALMERSYIDEDDDEETHKPKENESSGVSNIAGYTLPVGASNSNTGWEEQAEESAAAAGSTLANPDEADTIVRSAMQFARASQRNDEY